jgi:hypothetical protein
MAKLSKTELNLIDIARKYGDGKVHAQMVWGQTGTGAHVKYGSRDVSAFQKLVNRGLVENVTTHNSSHVDRGYHCHSRSYYGDLIENNS